MTKASKIKKRDRWMFPAQLAIQLIATENPAGLVSRIAREIIGQVKADSLLNYLADKTGKELVLNALAGISHEVAHPFEQIDSPISFCQTPALYNRNRRPKLTCPYAALLNELINTQGIKCIACHPLLAHGRLIGVLIFGSHGKSRFAAEDLELMRLVAVQISMAIYRTQNEQNLREAEERWRILSEATFEGILINENGVIVDLNQQLADLVGWPLEEIKGQEILKFIDPEDWEKVQATIASDQEVLMEYRVIHRDGSRRIFEARSRPSMLCGGFRGVTVVRDITHQKQMEAEILKRGRELEELTARLEQRVRDRTHKIEQLATQLRALSMKLIRVEQKERLRLASLLHDDIQQLLVASKMRVELCMKNPHPEQHSALCEETQQILQEALNHCRSLVVELCPPILQQNGLVAALHWLAEQYELKHRFKVNVQADSQADPPSQELRSLLFESARELLLNAVKYSQVMESQLILSRTSDQEISLRVVDQGKGFDPNAQLDQTTSGFGLFSIQQRLTHIGGRMEINSTPGQGTCLTLLVPHDLNRPPQQLNCNLLS